jgi:hypothetical protein
VVADGFSCRTQIQQGGTGRQAVHVAQVLQRALRPADAAPRPPTASKRGRKALALAVGGVAVLLASWSLAGWGIRDS